MSRFGVDIKDHSGLKRDIKTGAIIHTDKNEYRNFMTLYKRKEADKLEMQDLKAGYQELSKKVDEILEILKGKV